MRYLILDAHYGSTGIKSLIEGYLNKKELRLSYHLWAEIIDWRDDYASTLLMPSKKIEKASSLKKIYELDKRGVALIQQLLDELECNVKIRYYSEGMLGYLSYYKANPSLFGKPYVNEFHNKVFSNIKNE